MANANGRLADSFGEEEWHQLIDKVSVSSRIAPARIHDVASTEPMGPRDDPCIPPANGKCLLLELPTEILRDIFQRVTKFPSRHRLVNPRQPQKSQNAIRSLLVLNQRIFYIVSDILYDERTFGIYVFEGLKGGVEFLDSGIQPLQHKYEYGDRFSPRFNNDDRTGVARLRKVVVTIFPYDSGSKADTRHIPLLTYFKLSALCNLLQRGGRRLTSLTVRFEQPIKDGLPDAAFFDPKIAVRRFPFEDDALSAYICPDQPTPRPKASSISGLSNLEVTLAGFETMWGVHNARVILPQGAEHIEAFEGLAQSLEAALTRRTADKGGDVVRYLMPARTAFEEWVNSVKNGGSLASSVEGLTEEDMMEDTQGEFDDDEDDFEVIDEDSSDE